MSVTVPMDKLNEAIQDIIGELRIESFEEFWDKPGAEIVSAAHMENFSSSTSPAGESWEPWHWRSLDAPDTHNTLIVSGELKQSLNYKQSNNISIISATVFEFGTSVAYAAIHQEGADITTGIPMVARDGTKRLPAGSNVTIPARPFTGLNDERETNLVDALADWIVEPLT